MPDETPKSPPGLSLTFTTDSPPQDPITFTIDGESFDCLPWLPGGQFLRFSRLMASTNPLDSAVLVEDFFAVVMEPAEHERFTKFINDPSRYVQSKLLADLFLALWVKYQVPAGETDPRPTEPPTS